jgi:hypothetical protein
VRSSYIVLYDTPFHLAHKVTNDFCWLVKGVFLAGGAPASNLVPTQIVSVLMGVRPPAQGPSAGRRLI